MSEQPISGVPMVPGIHTDAEPEAPAPEQQPATPSRSRPKRASRPSRTSGTKAKHRLAGRGRATGSPRPSGGSSGPATTPRRRQGQEVGRAAGRPSWSSARPTAGRQNVRAAADPHRRRHRRDQTRRRSRTCWPRSTRPGSWTAESEPDPRRGQGNYSVDFDPVRRPDHPRPRPRQDRRHGQAERHVNSLIRRAAGHVSLAAPVRRSGLAASIRS